MTVAVAADRARNAYHLHQRSSEHHTLSNDVVVEMME